MTTSITKRQATVLDCLLLGYANKRIAQDLGISDQTVKNHVTAIFEALGLPNRVLAALWWREHRAEVRAALERPRAPRTLDDYLADHLEYPACGCWVWTGALHGGGPAGFWAGMTRRPRRLLYVRAGHALTSGEYVQPDRGTCTAETWRRCCNPAHQHVLRHGSKHFRDTSL